jgi:hypothetical protein
MRKNKFQNQEGNSKNNRTFGDCDKNKKRGKKKGENILVRK